MAVGFFGNLIESPVPEPISTAQWRRMARLMVWVPCVLGTINVLTCFAARLDPTVDQPAMWRYLEINLPAHVAIVLINVWVRRGTRSERAYRLAAEASLSLALWTVVTSLWVTGSVTSWNFMWLPILIGAARIYFDAALGRHVLVSALVQYAALIALEGAGVIAPHAAVPLLVLPEYSSLGHEVVGALWIAVLCVFTWLVASHVANRIRTSEHSLRELNQTLEARVREQVSQLERAGRLRRYLAPQVVERLLAADVDPVAARARRPITVMFADLKGFTPMTEALEPEVLASVLTRYFSEVAEIAFRHGGTIDKFIGDAVMVFFGAPEATGESDQAIRCVRMALEVQRRVGELGTEFVQLGALAPLEVRIGIGSGQATVGEFGALHRSDFTAVGAPVNRAARLEPLAPPGGILIDAETHALVGDRVVSLAHGEHALKGFSRPQHAFLVERIAKIQTLKEPWAPA